MTRTARTSAPGTSADFGVSSALVAGFEHETVVNRSCTRGTREPSSRSCHFTRSAHCARADTQHRLAEEHRRRAGERRRSCRHRFGAVVSTVQSYDVGLALPARSVAVTVTLWAPSAREPVSNELTQAADVAPSTAQVRVEPDSDSVKLTTLSATFRRGAGHRREDRRCRRRRVEHPRVRRRRADVVWPRRRSRRERVLAVTGNGECVRRCRNWQRRRRRASTGIRWPTSRFATK